MTSRHQYPIIEPQWPAPDNIVAFTTTRFGGFSLGRFAANNLDSTVGESPQTVRQNRDRLKQQTALPNEPVWLEQVHGAKVINLDAIDPLTIDSPVTADASWTSQAGKVCAVLTADCLPIVLCERQGGLAAIVHGGWRGLTAGVIDNTLSQLTCPREQLMAWIGPSISQKHFTVQAEVCNQLLSNFTDCQHAIQFDGNEHWRVNLATIAQSHLKALGVNEVYTSSLCTYEDPRFYSYRQAQDQTGRQATVIYIKA
jgi:YfiH family protein